MNCILFIVSHLWEHTVHCKKFIAFKYIHDFARDVIFDIIRWTEISVKKEVHANFLIDPLDRRSTLTPVDVIKYVWVRGKHVCVDLIGGFTTCAIRGRAFTVGHTSLKDVSSKMVKYGKTCYGQSTCFYTICFYIEFKGSCS